jgi:hypothetical protein
MLFLMPKFDGTESAGERMRLICRVNQARFYFAIHAIAMAFLFLWEPMALHFEVIIYVTLVGGLWILLNRMAQSGTS